jgi:hypothetical protein
MAAGTAAKTRKDQPLADETVQGRQAADGHGAEGEKSCRPGHGPPQAAQAAHLPGARGVQHGARAQKEQGLEEPVIPDMEQPAGQGQDSPLRAPLVHGDHGEAQADEDDADVLHAVVGQQTLQVVLAQREGHSEDRAGASEPGHDPARRRWQRQP